MYEIMEMKWHTEISHIILFTELYTWHVIKIIIQTK